MIIWLPAGGGFALNKRVEALPSFCQINEAVTAIKQGFIDAANSIKEGRKEKAEYASMDAVAEAVKICYSPDRTRMFLVVGHIGDSRTHVRSGETGELVRVTNDHTLVDLFLKTGQITQDEAFNHPQRHAVLRSIGDINTTNVNDKLQISVVEIKYGDIIISSSDGLGDNIPEKAIEGVFRNSPEALERARTSNTTGFAMHLAESAYGIMKQMTRKYAKPDDVSVLTLIPQIFKN